MLGWLPPLSQPPPNQPPPTGGGPIHPPFPPNPPPEYAEMIARLDALERGMREIGLLPVGIGHNHPPEDQVLSPEDRAAISGAIATLKAQPPQPATRAPEAINAAEELESVAKKVGAYLRDKVDLLADAFVKGAGGAGQESSAICILGCCLCLAH